MKRQFLISLVLPGWGFENAEPYFLFGLCFQAELWECWALFLIWPGWNWLRPKFSDWAWNFLKSPLLAYSVPFLAFWLPANPGSSFLTLRNFFLRFWGCSFLKANFLKGGGCNTFAMKIWKLVRWHCKLARWRFVLIYCTPPCKTNLQKFEC